MTIVRPRVGLPVLLIVLAAIYTACGAGPAATPAQSLSDLPAGGPPQVSGPAPAAASAEIAQPAAAPVPPPAAPGPTPAPSAAPPPGPPPPRRVREVPPPALGAQAAIVVDGDSGAVLFDKDGHTPLPPASTTKIMTALLALERGRLDDEIEVQLDNRAYWGSVMGVRNGDRFTLRDLLYGLMLPSGNDAAYVIAVHLAGSERSFADQMTDRMRELGLTESVFINASGLGRTEVNLVSAHDLAQLARYAMRNPEFARIVNTRSWTARGSRVIGMNNSNGLLFTYAGADGVKIGFGGRSAGNTIVGSAVRGGHRVFVALLNVPDRDGEAAALLNWAFTSFAWDGGNG